MKQRRSIEIVSTAAALLATLVAGGVAQAAEAEAKKPSDAPHAECAPAKDDELALGVRVSIPHQQIIGGVVVRVDYPADKVMLPGSGAVNGAGEGIEVLVPGAESATNDLGDAVRVMVAQAGEMTLRDVLTITFAGCKDGKPATPADFACAVEQVRDPAGNEVRDATCEVFARETKSASAAD